MSDADSITRTHYTAEGSSLKGVYNFLFGGKDKPLCKATHQSGGSCATAVGATSWHLSKQHDAVEVYGPDGAKQAVTYKCNVNVITPQWEGSPDAPPAEHDEVVKFMKSVDVHELGHAEACQQLKRTIATFLEQLPPQVPPETVAAMNAGVNTFVTQFYERQARKSDKLFDRNTGHGGKGYAAQLTKSLHHKDDPLTQALKSEGYGGTAGVDDSDSEQDENGTESDSEGDSADSEEEGEEDGTDSDSEEDEDGTDSGSDEEDKKPDGAASDSEEDENDTDSESEEEESPVLTP